jgi:hypothetical protein
VLLVVEGDMGSTSAARNGRIVAEFFREVNRNYRKIAGF